MANSELIWLFIPLLFIIAFLYASVGHGGASGYLALMALFGFQAAVMKPSSLLLNLFVSAVAFYQYWRGGYFSWKLFFPFALASVPASFLGSFITIDALLYKRILGVLLVFPVLRMMGVFGERSVQRELKLVPALIAGACIGLLSGMIGIGGGIILSPLILLMGWGNIKESAAVSALFIFVNSLSGLAGLASKGLQWDAYLFLWIVVAFAGGITGAYIARVKFSNRTLQWVLSLVLLVASAKLLMIGK